MDGGLGIEDDDDDDMERRKGSLRRGGARRRSGGAKDAIIDGSSKSKSAKRSTLRMKEGEVVGLECVLMNGGEILTFKERSCSSCGREDERVSCAVVD
jgi:hypothetical protein